MNNFNNIIEKYKAYTDKIFSSIFIKSFNNDAVNKELMKQWAVFTDKIDNWNNKYFYKNFNSFFSPYNYENSLKAVKELYDIFNETFGLLYEKFFFIKNFNF